MASPDTPGAPKWTCLRDDEPYFIPERPHANDAGFDMTLSRDVVLEPGTLAALPTNVAVALPDHMWALLVGRSSTFYRRSLLVNAGIIDPGYRGEIMGLVYNFGRDRIIAHKGEKLFQLVPITQVSEDFKWEYVRRGKDLPVSHRGASGVGSTGGYITTAIDPVR